MGRSLLLFVIFNLSLFGATSIPITGASAPGMASYDRIVPDMLARWNIPGASVAVVRNGKLVFARGYGYADKDAAIPVQPDSLFRIVSMSKPVTSAAILHLVDLGKLNLDDKAFVILNQFQPLAGKTPDPRLKNITIRNLLQHSAGWDYSTDPVDPSDDFVKIANLAGDLPPATCEDDIRYMMGRPLDFDPGTRYAYYNFNYCVLGRVVEKIGGLNYEDYVRANVFAPMGIRAMRIGRALPESRFPGEVHYYDYSGADKVPYAFPGYPGLTPYPDGGYPIAQWDSFGGWIASAIDLTRFFTALDGHRGPAFLSPAMLSALIARPNIPDWANTTYWYGLGWQISPQRAGPTWTHNGTNSGSYGYMLRANDGVGWAVLFNSLPANDGDFSKDAAAQMQAAFDGVTSWPTADLYPQYPSVDAAPSPRLSPPGVVNGASFTAGVAPGALVSIIGANFAPQNSVAPALPLPPTLGNISVTINRQISPLLFVSPTQINFQLPFEISPGTATAVVTVNGLASAPMPFVVNAAAPGIFQFGANRAIVQNQDGTLNDSTHPASAGNMVVAYMTGQGLLDVTPGTGSAALADPLARPKLPLTASVGGQPANVAFAGLTPGFVGLLQVNLAVPAVPPGDYPLMVTVGGKTSNTPMISIQ